MPLTPSLTLNATLNDPFDDAAVIGFEGRDTIFGRDCTVIKREELPDVPEMTGTPLPLPENVIDQIGEINCVFVLDDEEVYEIDATTISGFGRPVVVEQNGTEASFTVVDVTEAKTYDRDDISISN